MLSFASAVFWADKTLIDTLTANLDLLPGGSDDIRRARLLLLPAAGPIVVRVVPVARVNSTQSTLDVIDPLAAT